MDRPMTATVQKKISFPEYDMLQSSVVVPLTNFFFMNLHEGSGRDILGHEQYKTVQTGSISLFLCL